MVKGWYGNKMAHKLASKGIKSKAEIWTVDEVWEDGVEKPFPVMLPNPNYKEDKKFWEMLHKAMKDGKSFEEFLDTDEGQKYAEMHFRDSFEVPFDAMSEESGLPYWLESYEDYLDGNKNVNPDGDEYIESVYGIYDKFEAGDIIEINGEKYYYKSGLIGIEEIELQAENGELVYHYMGNNFFRIWKPLPETYILVKNPYKENEMFTLIDNGGDYVYTSESLEDIEGFAEHELQMKSKQITNLFLIDEDKGSVI